MAIRAERTVAREFTAPSIRDRIEPCVHEVLRVFATRSVGLVVPSLTRP